MTDSTRPSAGTEGAGGQWIRGSLRAPAGGLAAGGGDPAWLIVKIGGSILSRPRWPALLARLLDGLERRPRRLVVGGGAIVDGLRAIDAAAPQPAAVVHGLAIDAMRLTAQLVASALGLPLVDGVDSAIDVAVLDVPSWLPRSEEAARIPAGWQVTSDTIAACAAAEHDGGLLLVKSVPPPPCPTGVDPILAASQSGWVDEHFPVAAARLAEIGWAAARGI